MPSENIRWEQLKKRSQQVPIRPPFMGCLGACSWISGITNTSLRLISTDPHLYTREVGRSVTANRKGFLYPSQIECCRVRKQVRCLGQRPVITHLRDLSSSTEGLENVIEVEMV